MAYDPIPRVNAAGVAVWSAKVAGDSNNRNQITADGQMSWGPGNAAVDTFMSRSTAGEISLGEVDGTGPHRIIAYNTRSASGVNFERLTMGWSAGNIAQFITSAGGTGAGRTIQIRPGGDLQMGSGNGIRWKISANHLQPFVDNVYDGGSPSLRIRSVYVGTSISVGGTVGTSGSIRIPNNVNAIVGRNAANDGDVTLLVLDSSDNVRVGSSANAINNISFYTGNTARWTIASDGDLYANTDNSWDFGRTGATRPRSIYWGTQALGPDGSAATPSYGFASETNTGISWGGASLIDFSFGGTLGLRFIGGALSLKNDASVAWSSTSLASGTRDLFLFRDAANTLAQRNGVNAQTFNLYGTWTNASNYERVTLDHDGTDARLNSTSAGTGTTGLLRFQIDGSTKWLVHTDASFRAGSDNANDVGTGGGRPRSVFIGTSISIGTDPAGTGDLRLANNGQIKGRNSGNTTEFAIVYLSSGNVTTFGSTGVPAEILTSSTITLTGRAVVTDVVTAGATPTGFTFTGAAHGTMIATVEAPGMLFNAAATKQWATGAIVAQREFKFMAPTYAFVGASVISDAATVYISGAPILGTNATFTRSFALWVNAGISRFDGNVEPGSNNAVDLGTASLNWRSGYFGTTIEVGTSPSVTGGVRIANNLSINWRNNADNGNLIGIAFGTDDQLYIANNNGIVLRPSDGALRIDNQTDGAGSSAGTLTNAPSVGDPDFWIPINIAGTAHWIPAWAA